MKRHDEMQPRFVLAGLFCLAVLGAAQHASAQVVTRGAEIRNERISVNSASHWENWSIPTHAVDVVGDAVVPHYFRMRFNVLEDYRTYRRSIDELNWPVDDKFRVHGGVGAFTAVPNVQRTFLPGRQRRNQAAQRPEHGEVSRRKLPQVPGK